MAQEYKNNPLSLTHLIAYGSGAAIQLAMVYVLVFAPNRSLWEIPIYLVFAAILGCLQYLAWQSGKTTIVVAEDRLILKQFNKTLEARWDEIRSIRKLFTIYAGYSYLVKTRQGITLGIPDTMKHHEELLAIIQQQSGQRISSEWRGLKADVRDDWVAFLRWIRTHPLEFLIILLIIGGTVYAATRWLIRERQLYGPSARFVILNSENRKIGDGSNF